MFIAAPTEQTVSYLSSGHGRLFLGKIFSVEALAPRRGRKYRTSTAIDLEAIHDFSCTREGSTCAICLQYLAIDCVPCRPASDS